MVTSSATSQKGSIQVPTQEQIKNFFEQAHFSLEIDQVAFENNVAEKSKAEFLKKAICGDFEGVVDEIRKMTTLHYIRDIITKYVGEIMLFDKLPYKLYFAYSFSEVSAWVVINDDDDADLVKKLNLLELKINRIFSKHGFRVITNIVEKSDNSKVPTYYTEWKIKKVNGKI